MFTLYVYMWSLITDNNTSIYEVFIDKVIDLWYNDYYKNKAKFGLVSTVYRKY